MLEEEEVPSVNPKLDAMCEMLKTIHTLNERNKMLEVQIERMKNWCNCKNYWSCLEECCRKNISFEKGICHNCKKWEIKR